MSQLIATIEAACPSCEASGRLGSPCQARACAKQGLNAIPLEHARAAWSEASSKREPLVGHFVGDFLIVSRLGKGGFGKVLLGLQRPLFKLAAAVKLLDLSTSDERMRTKVLEKFEHEAAVLAVLQHPNIVRLIHFGSFEDQPFLAMEFVPGARTLQSEINKLMLGHESLPPDTIKRILDQVLVGLEAAHEQQIIHRDIKPENIMLQRIVGDPWHVKLLDFGLAKVVAESRETSMVMGTVQYMAPEQIEGKNLGAWTDLYAVGCIAFEFITGFRAFPGRDTQAILRAKLDPSHDPLAQLGDHGLPDAAVGFLERALARQPLQRFRSAAEMRAGWSKIFALPTGSVALSRDLSHLSDSEDHARLREGERRLAEERNELARERASIEVERRRLESDRVRVESNRLGTPEHVEREAVGPTEVPRAAGRTRTLPPGGAGPSEPLDPRRLPWAPPPVATGTQTVEQPAPEGRSRVALWAIAAALVVGGGALVLAITSGSSEPVAARPTTPPTTPITAPATAARAEERPPTRAAERPAPTSSIAARDVADPIPASPTPVPTEIVQRYRAAIDALDGASLALPAEAMATVRAKKDELERELAAALALGGADGARAVEALADRARAFADGITKVPAASTSASVTITSTPTAASVSVDGVDRGVTPLILETTIGARHALELSAKGRAPETRELVVDKAASVIEVALRPRAAPAPPPPPTRAPILPP